MSPADSYSPLLQWNRTPTPTSKSSYSFVTHHQRALNHRMTAMAARWPFFVKIMTIDAIPVCPSFAETRYLPVPLIVTGKQSFHGHFPVIYPQSITV